ITIWVPQHTQPKFPLKVVKSDKLTKPGAVMEQTVAITLSNVKLGQAIPASVFAVPSGYTIKAAKAAPKAASMRK
ncbi:MAG TPA: hypothetical protein VFU47_05110, partial [Armatimonadota bacterium]|nr:hypothetical protein [Armatimonadota bacterium]